MVALLLTGAFVFVTADEPIAEQFPPWLALDVDNRLPVSGDTVEARIDNWPDRSGLDIPVHWELIDGERTRPLDATSPVVTVSVTDGPRRVIGLVARVQLPDGTELNGEFGLLVNGKATMDKARQHVESVRLDMADFTALTGARRDAYALCLYALEKVNRRDQPSHAASTVRRSRTEQLLDMVDAVLAGDDPYQGRTGLFEAAYLSDADGTAQPFMLSLPASYADDRRYALFVDLHGGGGTHERGIPEHWQMDLSRWLPFADAPWAEETIGVNPARGRGNAYRGLGEDDMLQVIRWIRDHYTVDPDRTYLHGGSMGGMGTWYFAAQYPDMFAGAMVDSGSPETRILPNLLHVPTYVRHGADDWIVSVGFARLGVSHMRHWDCPVVYSEYAGIGHDVGTPTIDEGFMTLFHPHRRVTDPEHIRIHAAHPRYAAMYWGTIVRWQDPHREARLEARILPGNVVSVSATNVAQARLQLPAGHLSPQENIVWMVEGQRLSTARTAEDDYIVEIVDGTPRIGPTSDDPVPPVRPYTPGSFMNLYRGEPLLIVYGTTSSDPYVARAIKAFADEAATWLMPGQPMTFGATRAVADTAIAEAECVAHNLFLIGGPEDNAATARLMPDLPVRERDGALHVFGAESLPLKARGYGFLHPNPAHPQRLVFIYASSSPAFYAAPNREPIRGSRFLREAWRDPVLPDLFVESVDDIGGNRVVKSMTFTYGWQPQAAPAFAVARHPESAREYEQMLAAALRRAASAPFAIVGRGRAEDPNPYHPETIDWPGITQLFSPQPPLTIAVTGSELLALAAVCEKESWMILPQPSPDTIESVATYRIAAYEDAMWALGNSQHRPRNIRLLTDPDRVTAEATREWGVTRQ